MTAATTEPVSRFWSRISMVADIARMLRDNPFEGKNLTPVLKHIARVAMLDAVTLYVHDRERDDLERLAHYGTAIDALEFLRFDHGDGLIGWAAGHKEPIVIQGRDPEHDHVKFPHDSVMILPLTVAENLIGVLCCGSHSRQAFDAGRQELMEIVADQMAVSLERFLYQRDLESKNRSLIEARKELEETQAQLVAQEKLRAVCELAASVNQEVNNPLAIIIGNAQIIELEASGLPQKVTRHVQAIVDGARRISLITHKLSKIDRLVTESYLPDQKSTMLNIHKSAGEHK